MKSFSQVTATQHRHQERLWPEESVPVYSLFFKNKAPEVILIANIRTVDEWRGFADMLGNLIAKYASVLDELEKSDTSDKDEQQKAA